MSSRIPPRLPADVVHCVLVQVLWHEIWDPYWLGKCSLVCKEWCDVARPLLFSIVFVKARPNGIKFYQFFDFVRSHPQLAQYIKRLTLTVQQRAPREYFIYHTEQGGDDVEDAQEGEGLPALYGEDAAMLDFPAFLSVLPHFKGLEALCFEFVALWIPEGSDVQPTTLALGELFVHSPHCSLPALFSALQISQARKVFLDCYDIGDWEETPLPVLRVNELNLESSYAASPQSFIFYERIFNPHALRSLSVRFGDSVTVHAMCDFMRNTDVGGLTNLTMNFESYFGLYSLTAPIPVPWDAIAEVVRSCKQLQEVEFKIPPWVSGNRASGVSPFSMSMDLAPFLRATLPALPQLTLRLRRAIGDGRALAPHMMDEVVQDLSMLDDICSELYPRSSHMDRLLVSVQCALFRSRSVPYELIRSETIARRVRDAMRKLGAAGLLKVEVTDY